MYESREDGEVRTRFSCSGGIASARRQRSGRSEALSSPVPAEGS